MKILRFHVEGQDITVHAKTEYVGGNIALIVHNLDVGWRGVVNITFQPLYPWKITPLRMA